MSGAYATSARLPLGVAVLSILIGLFGFFVLVTGLVVVLLGVGAGIAGGSSVFGLTGTIAGLVILALGGVILAVAAGLWDQQLWALALAVIVLLLYGAVELFAGAWLAVAVIGALLLYLVAVSSAFD